MADDPLRIRDGRLELDGCDLADLAQEHGAPLYVYSERALRQNLASWTAVLRASWPEGPTQLLPAVKANYLGAIQRIVASTGAGADTFGEAEFAIARAAGFAAERISVNGSKPERLIHDAVAAGARITVDNIGELPEIRAAAVRAGRRAHVRFRVRPDLRAWTEACELVPEPVPVGELVRIYKPGVPLEDLVGLDLRRLPELDVAGLHVHATRSTRTLGYWEFVGAVTAGIAADLMSAWPGWRPRELDLGGGFPSPRDSVGLRFGHVAARRSRAGAVPPLAEYAAALTGGLRASCARRGVPLDGVLLELEPGRGLFGDVGVHLATVRRLKVERRPALHRWVELDTSEVLFPNGEGNVWEILVANRAGEEPTQVADLVGCSCEFDQMLADAHVPELRPGDVVAFLDAGAYQEVAASNFNALPRPAAVLVSAGRARAIRRRETLADITARELEP